MNKAIIMGRLGNDPEMKTITGGQTVTNFSLATSESWQDKSGDKQERTEWHNIIVWGKPAEICHKYLSKGSQVLIEGKIQTKSWEDSEGNKKYRTEIVAHSFEFVGGKNQEKEEDKSDSIPF